VVTRTVAEGIGSDIGAGDAVRMREDDTDDPVGAAHAANRIKAMPLGR